MSSQERSPEERERAALQAHPDALSVIVNHLGACEILAALLRDKPAEEFERNMAQMRQFEGAYFRVTKWNENGKAQATIIMLTGHELEELLADRESTA